MSESTRVAALECAVWTSGVLMGVVATLFGGPSWTWAAFVGTCGTTIVSKRLARWLSCKLGWVSSRQAPVVF